MYGNHHIITTRAVTITVRVLGSIAPKKYSTSVVNLVPLTVDGTIGVVNSLVMEWDTILGLVHL